MNNNDPELEHLAPTLFSIKKDDPFKVEEGYFERFPHQVQGLVSVRSTPGWNSWWKPALVGAIPAAMLITAMVIFFSAPEPTTPTAAEQLVEEVTLNDLETIDPALDLIAYVEHEELAFDEVSLALTEEELHTYFEEQELDLEQLLHEL